MCVNMFEDFFLYELIRKEGRYIMLKNSFWKWMWCLCSCILEKWSCGWREHIRSFHLKKLNYSGTSSARFMRNKGVNSWMNNQSINNNYWHLMLLVNQYHSIIENTHKESINIINIRFSFSLVNQYHSIIEDTPKQWIIIINIRCSLLMVNQYQSIIEYIIEQSINKSQYSFIE